MAKSDQNLILRRLPIFVGGVAGILLMINRLFTPQLTDSQARADAVGVIVSAVLILTGLLWQQFSPRSPAVVKLTGVEGFELAPALPQAASIELAWASQLLLTNTVTRSLVVFYHGKTLLRRGILGTNAQVKPGPILQRVLEKHQPVYLVDLKIYPGRIEFDYLPENTQGVICQPIGAGGVLILGANAPRSFTKQDENWIAGIAEKLDVTLSSYLQDDVAPVGT